MGSYHAPPYDHVRAGPFAAPSQPHQQQQQHQQPPQRSDSAAPLLFNNPNFDILDWHPAYTSCQRYFLNHAQHEASTQALCALMNIRLPYQHGIDSAAAAATPNSNNNVRFISLVPYIRRLIVTGFDKPAILHGFFGNEYVAGVQPHVACERRNYLFAAKHGGWRSCKKQYDAGCGLGGGGTGADETVPFMKPLEETRGEELRAAEKAWSEWLGMEDWELGPRAAAQSGSREGEEGRAELEVMPDGVGQVFGGTG